MINRVGRNLQAESCLSASTWSGQREQPDVVTQQEGPGRRELRLAPDEWRRLNGQVVRAAIERPQCGKVCREPEADHLADLLGLLQIPQSMPTKIPEPNAL